jgi:hypothetical protein
MKLSIGLFIKVFYFVISPLILISYLLEPWTDDIRIYLGAAKVTALTSGFPLSLDAVWESRFVGHRFLYYILNLVTPFSGWLYSIWMKALVAIVTFIILYYFSKRVSDKMQISFHYPFILGILGLFAINNFIIFSAEYFSVVIAMLMLTLLLDDREWCQRLSGLLVLPLLILKGLPVMLVLIVILAIAMLVPDYKDRLMESILSLPLVFVSLLVIILYFPHFISDIFLITKLAHLTMLDPLLVIQYFFKYGIGVIGFVPLILIGAFMLFMIVATFEKDHDYEFKRHVRDFGLLLAMWLVAAVYVLFLSEFFYYHYYLMLIPAILTICYFLRLYDNHQSAFMVIVISVLIIFAAVVSGWSWGLSFKGYAHWSERDAIAADILSRYDLLDQPTTLFLDYGSAAYYFPTKSECRYVGALPYLRHTKDWDLRGTSEYWEMNNCSLNYTGKYIITENWFDWNSSILYEMTDKLNKEYTKVYSNNWDIYQRKV